MGYTLDDLKQSFKSGAVAVNVWKNIGMTLRDQNNAFILIDNDLFDPIFDYLEKKGMPLLGHIGEPLNCWLSAEDMTINGDREYFKNHPEYHMYLHPEYPSCKEIINSRDNLLYNHTDLSIFSPLDAQKIMQ